MEEPSIYIVVDIETDGPVLSRHSMRNLSAVVVDQAGKELDTFSENLLPIEGSIPDPGTLIWWQEKNSEVWAKITTDPLEAKEVIRRFEAFIREFEGQRIFVGHPLAFDGLWVSNYMEMFLGQGLMAFHDTQDPLFWSRDRLTILCRRGSWYQLCSLPSWPISTRGGDPSTPHASRPR
ncbi:3'-5' exoribonuclease domain-containing protein [Roseovarius nanhaiticus]|uniref:3'-5' exoribonuclease domain-containing protein n=1 Tax=Roseovarius nanhaiticus TaxID=573024 RepID=UPI00248FC324|nr:3'-5' exoribonuclease [Roseovarius nanhaiticus]